MAVVSIGHHPDLSPGQVMTLFQQHFGQRYEVFPVTKLPEALVAAVRRDFVIKKNAFVCVSVLLRQEPNDTKLVFTGSASSPLRGMLLGLTLGLGSWLLFNGITTEVRHFIETCDEFRRPQASRPGGG